MSTHQSANWTAWHDFMPGSEPTLHVKGEVTVPTTGYSANLVPAVPQGINPAIYLLKLVIVPPSPDAIVHQTVTTLEVHYQEDTRTRYTDVTILPEDITIPVQKVS